MTHRPLEIAAIEASGAKKRLNPRFVEWLMNFPITWTEGIPRADRLRALGNAVVIRQGAEAIRMLARRINP